MERRSPCPSQMRQSCTHGLIRAVPWPGAWRGIGASVPVSVSGGAQQSPSQAWFGVPHRCLGFWVTCSEGCHSAGSVQADSSWWPSPLLLLSESHPHSSPRISWLAAFLPPAPGPVPVLASAGQASLHIPGTPDEAHPSPELLSPAGGSQARCPSPSPSPHPWVQHGAGESPPHGAHVH